MDSIKKLETNYTKEQITRFAAMRKQLESIRNPRTFKVLSLFGDSLQQVTNKRTVGKVYQSGWTFWTESFTDIENQQIQYTDENDDLKTDCVVLKSFPQLYLEVGDPTGWAFANLILGSYEHYIAIRQAPRLEEMWKKIDVAMQAKLASEGFFELSKSKGHAPTAKWLAEGKFVPKEEKAKRNKRTPKDLKVDSDVEDDYKRVVKLKVVR